MSFRPDQAKSPGSARLLSIATAVVWVGCIAVGVTGILIPSVKRLAPVKKLAPVQAMLIHVDLSSDSQQPASPPPATPQQKLSPPGPPAPPPLPAVAEPTAAVAFALPTEGPTRTASAAEAAPVRPSQQDANAAPAVQRLTFGEGEGQQPKPEYPPEAKIAHQEGVVLVRFTIGEDGSVTTADAIAPCPFPMLNQSALRTIREDWRFSAGPVRVREIAIEFELKQK